MSGTAAMAMATIAGEHAPAYGVQPARVRVLARHLPVPRDQEDRQVGLGARECVGGEGVAVVDDEQGLGDEAAHRANFRAQLVPSDAASFLDHKGDGDDNDECQERAQNGPADPFLQARSLSVRFALRFGFLRLLQVLVPGNFLALVHGFHPSRQWSSRGIVAVP